MTTRRKKPKVVTVSVRQLHAACDLALLIIDDWIHVYAPEFCHDNAVARTRSRIVENGGTLAYLAQSADRIREIREIPRKKKPAVARATDSASRVWWADVDRAAKSARVLRDKLKRKRKRT